MTSCQGPLDALYYQGSQESTMISLPNPTKQEFSDFVATQDARNHIQIKIVEHCLTLCDKLREDYIAYSIKSCKRSIADYEYTYGNGASVQGNYFVERLEALRRGECDYDFQLDSSGRKYHKIWMYIDDKRSSIHAFIDKKTGEVFKPASIKAPAKGARYNVLSIPSREEMYERCDWAGGYLYAR